MNLKGDITIIIFFSSLALMAMIHGSLASVKEPQGSYPVACRHQHVNVCRRGCECVND